MNWLDLGLVLLAIGVIWTVWPEIVKIWRMVK